MHWLAHILGIDSATGRWYLWHSGIEGNLEKFGIFLVAWKRVNCHARWCWRLAHHYTNDCPPQHVCRKHHPDHPGRRPLRARDIHARHSAP